MAQKSDAVYGLVLGMKFSELTFANLLQSSQHRLPLRLLQPLQQIKTNKEEIMMESI